MDIKEEYKELLKEIVKELKKGKEIKFTTDSQNYEVFYVNGNKKGLFTVCDGDGSYSHFNTYKELKWYIQENLEWYDTYEMRDGIY